MECLYCKKRIYEIIFDKMYYTIDYAWMWIKTNNFDKLGFNIKKVRVTENTIRFYNNSSKKETIRRSFSKNIRMLYNIR